MSTIIETERLKIIPLSYEQAEMFTHLDSRLEDSLGLERAERELTTHYRNAIRKYTLHWIKDDPENYLFSTIWVIVEKASNTVAGDIGFKRRADVNGYVEIGYSTQPKYRFQGYITEAINAMTQWAFTHQEVNAVIAETAADNAGSIKALKNNGFELFKYSKPPEPSASPHGSNETNMLWHIKYRDE